MIPITPLFGRILIKELKQNTISDTIFIPETIDTGHAMVGYSRGVVIENSDSPNLSKGDVVIFNMRFARYVRVDNEDILVVDEKDILTVVVDD